MAALQAVKVSRKRAEAVLGLSCVLAVGGLVAGPSVAHGAPAPMSVAAKAPAGTAGQLTAVAAVPRSTDVWAIGSNGTTDNAHFFVGHFHHGHWHKVKTPNLHGRCGSIDTIVAASAKSVWIGGATQVACHSGQIAQTKPAVWQLKGNKFVLQKLPKLSNLSDSVDSISATSPHNAWAVGGLYPGATAAQVALHWNGKKWSAVTVPSGFAQTMYDVNASGPDNAWALRSDYSASQDVFVHWNGKVWTVGDPAPTGITLTSVTTSSRTLAYATGIGSTGAERSVILKFNGTKWSSLTLPKAAAHAGLAVVSMRGKAAWAVGDGVHGAVLVHSAGGAWKTERSPSKNYRLVSVSAGSATRAYAVGSYDVAGGGHPPRTFFDVLKGHSWKAEPSKF
jgi:hypothetical protein